VKPSVEEWVRSTPGAIGNLILRLLSDPWLIPLFVITGVFVVIVIHAYASTGSARATAEHDGSAPNVSDAGGGPETESPLLQQEPPDPDKKYNADLTYEVVGQGRYRYLICGLREDVGDGWDRGAQLEVLVPSKQIVPLGGWMGLDTPETRRAARRGHAVGAEAEGPYVIRCWSIPAPGYENEVMVEQTVHLPPTASLEGWTAQNVKRGDELLFRVEPDSPGRGTLRGFKCEVFGPAPGAPFVADDNVREKTFYGHPSPKERGEFVFPGDFADAPQTRNLHDGEYAVYWTAWEPNDDPDGVRLLDVARDRFSVSRTSGVEPSGTDGPGNMDSSAGLPGWESKVLGITREEGDDRLVTINLQLLTPDAKPSDEPVSAGLTLPSGELRGPVEARWNDRHLQEGAPPHYSLFFPSEPFGFDWSDPIENGRYTVVWTKRHGITNKVVTAPHSFEIRNGEIVTDVA
jgi:hypothetical protein